MLIVLFLVTALFLCLDVRRYKKICSPIVVFGSLWSVIVILASLRLFGFSGYTNKALLSVTCGVVGFGLSSLITTALLDRRCELAGRGKAAEGPKTVIFASLGGVRARLVNIVLVLVCIGEALLLLSTLSALLQGATYIEVRGALLGYSDGQAISTNRMLTAYITYFCGPALTALIPIAMVSWFDRKRPTFCVAVLLCLVAGVVASGGRITLVYVVGQLVVAFVFYRGQLSRRVKGGLLLVVGFAVVGVIALSILRSGTSLLLSVYSYLSVPMGLLSHFIETVDEVGFRSFGASFLYPFFYLLNAATRVVGMGGDFLGNVVHYVALPQEQWVPGLFPGRTYNAFATMFYYFYLDFGIVGVPVFSCLFGALMTYVFRKAFLDRSKTALLWYLLLFQTMLGSFMIWQLGGTKFFLSMCILGILTIPFERHSASVGLGLRLENGNVPRLGPKESDGELVNVIIPVYNVENYLERCLESVLVQTYANIRVWLVDDGSTDGSSLICDKYAEQDKRIEVIHKENGGQASARNLALDRIESLGGTEGEFVAFVDSDDWVEPDYIEFLIKLLRETSADAVQCGHYITYSVMHEVEKSRDHDIVEFGRKEALESVLRNGAWDITVWNKLFRMRTFCGLRFPEGKFYEDTAIAPLFTERLRRVAVSMESKYHYVQRYSSTANGTAWTNHKYDFISVGDEVAAYVLGIYPDLVDAAMEKRVFVRLSTLSQMVNTGYLNMDKARAKEMRQFVCENAMCILRDGRATGRDKLGVLMLLPGLSCYRVVWSLYYAMRRRKITKKKPDRL